MWIAAIVLIANMTLARVGEGAEPGTVEACSFTKSGWCVMAPTEAAAK